MPGHTVPAEAGRLVSPVPRRKAADRVANAPEYIERADEDWGIADTGRLLGSGHSAGLLLAPDARAHLKQVRPSQAPGGRVVGSAKRSARQRATVRIRTHSLRQFPCETCSPPKALGPWGAGILRVRRPTCRRAASSSGTGRVSGGSILSEPTDLADCVRQKKRLKRQRHRARCLRPSSHSRWDNPSASDEHLPRADRPPTHQGRGYQRAVRRTARRLWRRGSPRGPRRMQHHSPAWAIGTNRSGHVLRPIGAGCWRSCPLRRAGLMHARRVESCVTVRAILPVPRDCPGKAEGTLRDDADEAPRLATGRCAHAEAPPR